MVRYNRSSYEVDYDAILGKKIFESIEEVSQRLYLEKKCIQLDVNSIGTIFKYLFKNRPVCIVLIVICYAEYVFDFSKEIDIITVLKQIRHFFVLRGNII